MKHAIMVIGFGNDSSVLQKTIDILDDNEIDFFIHWDAKFKTPKLVSKHSKISYLDPIKVFWGTDTQILAERKLMKTVYESKCHYDYVHLISSSDMPLMTASVFKNSFKKGTHYIGFSDINSSYQNRMSFFWPIRHLDVRKSLKGKVIMKMSIIVNNILRINRIKDKTIRKGCNWFSMDSKYLGKIINYDDFKMFLNTYCADECYVQTILSNLDSDENHDDNFSTKRYIDWKRGGPYTFTTEDVDELSGVLNRDYAFARKISDSEIIDLVFNKLN